MGKELKLKFGVGSEGGLRRGAFIIFLILAGVLIYSNTLNSPFIFDDRLHIMENRHIRMEEFNLQNIVSACATN